VPASAHEGDVAGVITKRGVFRRFRVRVAEAPGPGEWFMFTTRKNLTIDTRLTVRITDDATYAENTDEDVEFNVGDTWAVRVDFSPGARPCRVLSVAHDFLEFPEGI